MEVSTPSCTTFKFINSLASPSKTPDTTVTTPSPSSATEGVSKGSSQAFMADAEFYAIRKGRFVESCIFPSWEHAKPHVYNFEGAVYNVFDRMEDAISYLKVGANKSNVSNHHNKRKRTALLPLTSNLPAIPSQKKSRSVSMASMTGKIKEQVLAFLPNKESKNDKFMYSFGERSKKNMTFSMSKKEANEEEALGAHPIEEDTRDLQVILQEGYKDNRVKGWRANDLFPGKRHDRSIWESRYLQDVNALKAYRESKPSCARDVHNIKHHSGIPNAFSLAYLNWSWGVGEAYHRYLAFQQRKNKPTKSRTKNNKIKMKTVAPTSSSSNTCVITNRDAARKRFTAKAMFYSFRVQQLAELQGSERQKENLPARPNPNDPPMTNSPLVNGCSSSKEWMDQARTDWELLAPADKEYWREQERLHDERQPQILHILEQSLAKDPKRSAKKLSEDIGYWCGKTTIGKWKNLRLGPMYRKSLHHQEVAVKQPATPNTADTLAAARAIMAVSNKGQPGLPTRVVSSVSDESSQATEDVSERTQDLYSSNGLETGADAMII